MMQPASPVSPVSPSPIMQHLPINGSHNDKTMRQLLSTMTKLQNVMSQIAERQGDILDRLSLLEQKGELQK